MFAKVADFCIALLSCISRGGRHLVALWSSVRCKYGNEST